MSNKLKIMLFIMILAGAFTGCATLEKREARNEELFPLHGVTLGKTTVQELTRLGTLAQFIDSETQKTYNFYNVQRVNFWYDEQKRITTGMYITRWEKLPDKWERFGFDWSLSYNEWISMVRNLGYSIRIVDYPVNIVKKASDGGYYPTFHAVFQAYKDAKYPVLITFKFSNSGGLTVDSKNTLLFIRAEYTEEMRGLFDIILYRNEETITLTDDRRRALALSGIYTQIISAKHESLEFSEFNEQYTEALNLAISKNTGIKNREDLLKTLQSIEIEGHSKSFEDCVAILEHNSNLSVWEIGMSRQYDDSLVRKLFYVKEIKDVVGNRGLKAWDYGRYIFLSRWGYQAGYLTEQEAWERILHAAQKVEGLYHSWEDYAAHYILGRMFWATAFKDEYKYGNEAILAYQVISHTENSVWTNSWGGITNSQNENIEQTAIEEILYVPSKSLRAWEIFIEGYRYYQGKLYEEAIDFFQKAFAVDPSITPLLLYIAQSHQLNGEKKKAIQYYLEYKEKNPENYWAHKYLGEAYENNMQIEDGIKEYSIAIGINDKIPEGHVGLGRSMLKQEKYPEAIMALSKAEKAYLERGGKSINYAMYLLGICYFKLHNYNEALSYFLRAYDAYRDNGYINYYLGFCYLNRDNQNVDSAKDYFRRALRMGIDLPPDIMDLLEQSDKDKLSDIILYTG